MSTRVWLCVELTKEDGPNVPQDSLREAFEEELPEGFDVEQSSYAIEVLGMGATAKELEESVKRRRAYRS